MSEFKVCEVRYLLEGWYLCWSVRFGVVECSKMLEKKVEREDRRGIFIEKHSSGNLGSAGGSRHGHD